MRSLLAVVALAACGGEDGEPLVGDLELSVDGDVAQPSTGAAIRDLDDTKELIVIGTRDISCNTSLGTPLRKGTYVTMLIDRDAMPGPLVVPVSFIRVGSSGTLITGDTAGMLTLDTLDARVAGSITFQATAEDGAVLEATGSFDVLNCSP